MTTAEKIVFECNAMKRARAFICVTIPTALAHFFPLGTRVRVTIERVEE